MVTRRPLDSTANFSLRRDFTTPTNVRPSISNRTVFPGRGRGVLRVQSRLGRVMFQSWAGGRWSGSVWFGRAWGRSVALSKFVGGPYVDFQTAVRVPVVPEIDEDEVR